MFQSRARNVLLLAMALIATACDGRRPTSPTAPPLTAPPPGPFTFEMTGVVTDGQGTPVPGARVAIWDDYIHRAPVLTDNSGRYTLNFNAVGTIHNPKFDPVGTKEAVAFAQIEAAGYERHARFVLGPGQHLVENVRLRRIERIKSGEAAVLRIAPDDSVCDLEVWPGRELICRTLRVVAPRDGTMTIEAVPSQAGSQLPTLEVWGDRTGGRGNPTSISVVAGSEYTVNVELPWGISTSQSFVVKTSM